MSDKEREQLIELGEQLISDITATIDRLRDLEDGLVLRIPASEIVLGDRIRSDRALPWETVDHIEPLVGAYVCVGTDRRTRMFGKSQVVFARLTEHAEGVAAQEHADQEEALDILADDLEAVRIYREGHTDHADQLTSGF